MLRRAAVFGIAMVALASCASAKSESAAPAGSSSSTSSTVNASRSATAYPPPAASEMAELRTLLLEYSSNMGEANPSNLELASTSFGLAMEAANPGGKSNADPNRHVYMLVAHGSFLDKTDAFPGGSPLTGTVIIVSVDAATHQEVDFTLTGADPNWTNVGPVLPL